MVVGVMVVVMMMMMMMIAKDTESSNHRILELDTFFVTIGKAE
jgi:hypothetical protein